MDPLIAVRRGETEAHARLKRLAILWAQSSRYSACAAEVSLPQCRYRADVAAYRAQRNEAGLTAIFECKQALPDLRRDNCRGAAARERLEAVNRRRAVLEKHLRVQYPLCVLVTRSFRNMIHTIFQGSNTATTVGFCVNVVHCRIAFAAAGSSNVWFATAAPISFFWLCLTSCFAIPKLRSAGVC